MAHSALGDLTMEDLQADSFELCILTSADICFADDGDCSVIATYHPDGTCRHFKVSSDDPSEVMAVLTPTPEPAFVAFFDSCNPLKYSIDGHTDVHSGKLCCLTFQKPKNRNFFL